MPLTDELSVAHDFPPVRRGALDVLQVNVGYRCNQACRHCHVNAGPNRQESMDMETVDLVLQVLETRSIGTLDITGGAPELNSHFRYLVDRARQAGIEVIDRCNLTVLFESGQGDMAHFLAEHGVVITASLPCYSQKNVDSQRGDGVFEKSIAALRTLNALGYGKPDGDLTLNLVYNPLGPFLPPEQSKLEADYRRELAHNFGIEFNRLYVLVNMPIQRFGRMLLSRGQMSSYMKMLKKNFMPDNLKSVMCRSLISVDWQGFLYDCDFNQILDKPLRLTAHKERPHLRDLLDPAARLGPVCMADHCHGCTAGQGSSCGGALAA